MNTPPVTVEVQEPVDPPFGFREVVLAILHPCWMVAIVMHLALILVLAIWFFPSRSHRMVIHVEPAAPNLQELDPLQEINIDPVQVQLTIPLEQAEDIDFPEPDASEMLQFEEDFAALHSLDDPLTDNPHLPVNTELADLTGQTEMDGRVDEIQTRVAQAGGKQGEVQFSLSWNTETDLDLHVITPAGERIHYRNRKSECRGLLDVDRNARTLTKTPVENVRWIRNPLPGRYTILVHLYQLRGNKSRTAFELMAKTGLDIDLQSTDISFRNRVVVFRYVNYSPNANDTVRKHQLDKWKSMQENEEQLASENLSRILAQSPNRHDLMWEIIHQFPHTDAAIRAWQMIPATGSK